MSCRWSPHFMMSEHGCEKGSYLMRELFSGSSRCFLCSAALPLALIMIVALGWEGQQKGVRHGWTMGMREQASGVQQRGPSLKLLKQHGQ